MLLNGNANGRQCCRSTNAVGQWFEILIVFVQLGVCCTTIYGVDNEAIGGETCATNFTVCYDSDVFDSVSPPFTVWGGSNNVLDRATAALVLAAMETPGLTLNVVDASSEECTSACKADSTSGDWGRPGGKAARVFIKTATLPGSVLATAHYGSSLNLYLLAGCLDVTFDSDVCWISDGAACGLLDTPVFAIVEIAVAVAVVIGAWVFLTPGGFAVVATAIAVGGMAQSIHLLVSCECRDINPVMIHEFGHIACMRHPDENVGAGRYFGNYYDAMSFMNSVVIDGANCITPMDAMSLQNAVGSNVTNPEYTQCPSTTSTSITVMVVVTLCGALIGGGVAALVVWSTGAFRSNASNGMDKGGNSSTLFENGHRIGGETVGTRGHGHTWARPLALHKRFHKG
jgi:hypothetical protein